MKSTIHNITLFFLFISLIFDPTGEFFKLKYVSVLVAFFVFGINFIFNYRSVSLSKYQIIYIVVFTLIMPLYGISVTLLNTSLMNITDTSYIGFSLMIFLLVPLLVVPKERFIFIFIFSLRVLKAAILLVLISFLIDKDSIGISQFFIEHKSLLLGFREYAGLSTYYIYFTASPLLIILVAYDSYSLLNRVSIGNILLLSLSIIAIFLTGTRFNMLVAILMLPIALILNKYSLTRIYLNGIIFLVFLIVLSNNSFTSSFFTSSEDSNNAKIGYLESYVPILENPIYLILGQGFNAHDWSYEFKNLMSKSGNDGTKTELTYLEFIRVFGIFFGVIFNLFVFAMPLLIYSTYKKINFLVVGILIYIFSSAINPYLFSTNGVLVFLLFLISIKQVPSSELVNKFI